MVKEKVSAVQQQRDNNQNQASAADRNTTSFAQYNQLDAVMLDPAKGHNSGTGAATSFYGGGKKPIKRFSTEQFVVSGMPVALNENDGKDGQDNNAKGPPAIDRRLEQ